MIRVVCGEPNCRRWATAYTTLEENPRKTWQNGQEFLYGHVVIIPRWYACPLHTTAKHHPLVGDKPPVCEQCGETDGVDWADSRTMYETKVSVWQWAFYGPEGPPDPNRSSPYCPDCTKRHNEYWDEMWSAYYGQRI